MMFLLLTLVVAAGCKRNQPTAEQPTESDTKPAVSPAAPAEADPFETARQWAASIEELPSDAAVAPIVSEWERGRVARLYRVDDGSYRALVTGPNSDETSPAVLLTIEEVGGAWKVTDTAGSTSDHLWPAQ